MTNFTPCGLASPSILSTRLSVPSSSRHRGIFLQQTGDPVAAQQLALQALENLRQQQASALAYFDVFLMFAVVMLMQRSVAEKDAHIGHE